MDKKELIKATLALEYLLNKIELKYQQIFNQNKEKIKKQYGESTFVVIDGTGIIDHHKDYLTLRTRYSNKNVLITSVKEMEAEQDVKYSMPKPVLH